MVKILALLASAHIDDGYVPVGTTIMNEHENIPARVRWARLRFSIIGPLLASPADAGELAARLDDLATKTYVHPSTGWRVRFARSTIERWYYAAKNEPRDPQLG